MYKFKISLDYTKEEKYLNEMSKKGYEFKDYGIGIYSFKKIKPENIIYRIDYRKFKNKQDYIDYCTMFEDSGWKKISGNLISGNQYFMKISENSDDDIFSDKASKAARYKRTSELWLSFACIYLAIFLSFMNSSKMYSNGISCLKELYYTEKLSESLVFAIKTPVALSFGLICMIYPIMIIMFFYFGYKSSKLYKESKKE